MSFSHDADEMPPAVRPLSASISLMWVLSLGSKLPLQGTSLKITLWPLVLTVAVEPRNVGRSLSADREA